MNQGDRLQTDRGHGLHIDWGGKKGAVPRFVTFFDFEASQRVVFL
jgi:hypothetical protein